VMISKLLHSFAIAAGLSAACVPLAGAQTPDNWPNRPIRMIIPTAAGGGSDVLGRLVASHLSTALGQPIVPDNRPGAGGVVGVSAIKAAPADGYTIGFSNSSQAVHSPLMQNPAPYDPTKDLDAIAPVNKVLIVLTANTSMPYRTLRELVDYARANPGKLSYGSQGTGTLGHFWVEMLKKRQNIDIVHVPYKGAGPTAQALIAGEVHISIADLLGIGGNIDSPRMRILVQLSAQRSARLPNVESVREAGYPDLASDFWFGFIGPRGMPPAIVKRLNEEINRVSALPEVLSRINAAGNERMAIDPAAFTALIAGEHKTYVPVFKELGLTPAAAK
jgi:tripartite-type tricarboxylate transporter receptor subunit TctC